MQVLRTIDDVRRAVQAARERGRRVACVPTMGALHAGHLSLLEAARRPDAFVVVTIFVNPTQFGPNEDFAAYPRDEAGDLGKCEAGGADAVFIPTAGEMYAPGAATTVHVSRLTETLCGPWRPGHFDGVATVVCKLLNIVRPDTAYFGQKDAQQLAVIRRMVRDLNLPVEIVGCETVREPDGLALSSRNAYLTPEQRQQATCLYRALCEARARIEAGERSPRVVTEAARAVIEAAGPAGIDYVEVVDPETMQPVERIEPPVLVALAVRIGRTRLIDNMRVDRALRAD